MKAIACLLMLSLAGYVSTQYSFEPGKSYKYEAQGRIMTGISEINRQYSGMEVKYQIVATAIGPNTILLDPQNFQATEVNAELKDGGWRDGEFQSETPVDIPSELKDYLESPIELTMKQGIVESMKVEGHLPTWAVNIKKAQASHFVLDTTGANLVLSGNLNRQTNSVRPEEANQESGFFYEVMENTVHGECETYYTVSQNGPFDTPYPWQQQIQPGQEQVDDPEYQQQMQQVNRQGSSEEQNNLSASSVEQQQQAREQQKLRQQYVYKQQQAQAQYQQERDYYHPSAYQQYKAYKAYAQQPDSASAEDSSEEQVGELPWPQAFDKFCDNTDQVYEIVKAINFTACKNKPTLAYSTAFGIYGRPGDNSMGSAMERAVITRYLACGKDRKQYTILKIQQEEQVNFGLRLNQKTLAGTVQNLTLVEITKAATPNHLQNPKLIQDLSYTFDPKEQQLQKKGQIPHAMDDINQDNQSQESQYQQTSTTSRYYSSEENSQEQSSEQGQKEYLRQAQQQYAQQQSRRSRKPRSINSAESAAIESSEESQEQWQNDQYQTDAENRGELPKPSLTSAPLNPFPITGLHTSGMKKRVTDLMQEIVQDITTDKESIAEAETLSKISTVAKILRYLNYQDVQELYHSIAAKDQTDEDKTARQIFLDASAIAGTNPNIKFLIDLIEKKELTGEHAAQIIMTFPMYIRTPTQAILKEVYELADSSAVESDTEQVKTTAILALSNLLYQACVNTRIANSRYPVAVYGKFCDQKHVQRKYADYFVKNVEKYVQSNDQKDNHWAITYLTALGNLGIPETIEVVQKILDNESDPLIKTKAVLALKHLIVSRSSENLPVEQIHSPDRDSQDELTDELIENQVLPVLMSVFNDKGEHPTPRMAAASLLFYTTAADITVWQQIAYSTWFPGSQEVHSFVYTTLKSLAQLEKPISPLHKKLQLKAKAVLSLAKPMSPSIAKSHNLFAAEFFQHLQTGYLHHVQWYGSKDSNLPNYFFYRNNLQYGNGAVGVNPIEFSVHGHTIQKLVNYMIDSYSQETSEQQAHPELQQIHEILGISQRSQEEDPQGAIRIKMRNEIERLITLNEEKIEQFVQWAKTHGLPKLMNGIPVNYQKTAHLMEHSMEIPSAMGFPMQYHLRMPVHVSVRGEIKLVMEEGMKDLQLQAELHPVYAWKTHGKLSFKVPFTGKKYQAGVQRHVVVEAPLRALIRKAPEGQVSVAITPTHLSQGSPSNSKIDLVTFHQRPYTAIILDEFWPTSHKEGGKPELIHATEEPYKSEETYGEELFGLSLTLTEESEYKHQREGAAGWVNFWKRFHAPSCFFNVGWLGDLNVRPVERKLSLDVSKSETKTLAIVVAYNKQENAKYRDLWQDSSSQSSQSSEESASSESAQDSSSQQMSSERSWERRQQQQQQLTRGQRRSEEQQQRRHSRRSQKQQQQQQQKGSLYSSEQEQQQQEGTVVAVALIGKRAPIRTPQENRGQIQKVLRSENPSTVQYLAQVSVSQGRLYVRVASGDAANEAAQQLPQTSQSLQALREIVVEAQNAKTQPDGCAELEGEYDEPKHARADQLLVLRQALLAQDLEVKVKAELQFGSSCVRMPHEVKAVGKLMRDQEQTQWAQEKSPEAQKCKEDEQKGFSVSPICIRVAEQQAAALNKADIKVTFSANLPIAAVNRTFDVEDFVKAMLYPYMSQDQFHPGTQERSIRVEAQMTPDKEFIDVTLTKPDSKLSFRSIQTNAFVKAVLPLTATQSMAQNVVDRALRIDSQTTCSIEGNQVNTFDNVTYRFNPEVSDDCYQILAKDCSGREPVAVLVKDVTAEDKEVIVLLGSQNKIELRQKSQQQSSSSSFFSSNPSASSWGQKKSQLLVKINEQTPETLPRVLREPQTGKLLATVEQTPNGQIQVQSEHFQVVTDGKYIVVYAANTMRNRTCGLCSNFDGEKVGEFRGPKDCQLSSGTLMVASYSYMSPNPKEKTQCKIQSAAKAQIIKEQAQCLKNSAYVSKSLLGAASRMFPNSGKYLEASSDCTSKCERAARSALFDTIDAVLKPFVWDDTKRAQYATRATDRVAAKIAQHLAQQNQADEIVKKLSEEIYAAMKMLPIPQAAIEAAQGAQGLFEKALLLALNPICEKSACCEVSRKPTNQFSPIESLKQVEAALVDESESDPSMVPYVTETEKDSMTCEQKLEKSLAKSISGMAYKFLLAKYSVPEVEKKRIRNQLERDVRKIVQRTMERGNGLIKPEDVQKLEEETLRVVREQFPDGKLNNMLVKIIKKLIPYTLDRLNKHEGCNFPIRPRQQQQQQQEYQQQSQQQQREQQQYNQQQQYHQQQQQQQLNKYYKHQQQQQWSKYQQQKQYQ